MEQAGKGVGWTLALAGLASLALSHTRLHGAREESAMAIGVPQQEPGAQAAGQEPGRGQALFERHCAVCHGPKGRGDGPAAYLLNPAPRNFASGKFRLVSTKNGAPTPADLIATIKRGMPGSAMPPWEWLAEEDLWNLADHVRSLAVEGIEEDLLAWASEAGEDLDPAEAREIAAADMKPGDPVDVGPPQPLDPVTLQEGRRIYDGLCASCHGPEGTGDSPQKLFNEDGTPTTARDFTAGIFKGGARNEDILRRILAGLPGSPMPATPFETNREAGLLAAFVRSLIRPGAEERVVQQRHTITVPRAAELPTEPDDPQWNETEGVWIALMPLWWRDDRIEGVTVRGLHDGSRISFRVSWRDQTQNDDLIGLTSFSDGAAIELSTQKDPPLFAMGATGEPVDIVLWRAAWERDLAAVQDVADRFPAMARDSFLPRSPELEAVTITARRAGNPQSVAERVQPSEDLRAQGFGTVGPRPDRARNWNTSGRWTQGFWDVVFVRPFEPGENAEVALTPGAHSFLAFAVWDGAAGDRNGQKSVSVWHRLEIER